MMRLRRPEIALTGMNRFLPSPARWYGGHRIALHVWLLVAVAAPDPVLSQQSPIQLPDRQGRMLGEIERIESEQGPHASELIEPLTALSLYFEETGEYWLAEPTILRLLQVIRVNDGIYSLRQVPSIQRLLAHKRERGDAAAAWSLEQQLLRLAERNPDDPRTAAILRDAGDSRMDLLHRYDSGTIPPEIILGCYYMEVPPVQRVDGQGAPINVRGTSDDSCTSGSRRRVRRNLVTEAQKYYSQAVNVLLGHEDYSSDELPNLLMDLANSGHSHGNPSLGRRSLRYLLAYLTTNSAPLLERIDVLVQIADWDLLYADGSRGREAALAQYAKALALLDDTPASRAWVDQTFTPAIPIRLPTFQANPFATTEHESSGHVDVALVVDRHGRSRHVRIVGASRNVPESSARGLKREIEHSRFRPQLVDGQFAETDTIVVRYYLQ